MKRCWLGDKLADESAQHDAECEECRGVYDEKTQKLEERIQQLESENVTWQAIANTHAKDLKNALQQLDLYRSMPKRW